MTHHQNRFPFRILVGFVAAAAVVSLVEAQADFEAASRGEYLVTIMSCHDCHTPFKLGPDGPEPDMSRKLSGHPQDIRMPPPPALDSDGLWSWIGSSTNTAFAGPWGVSFSANLTPDDSGIGQWTEQMFIDAIRNQRHEGRGRPLLPPMPAPFIKHATDSDLRAIFAYLRTLPPINNKVPQPIEPPEAN